MQPRRSEGERRMRARPAERDAVERHARSGAPSSCSSSGKAERQKPGAAIEGRQVKGRRHVKPREQQPAAQRIQHHPARAILDVGGEAMAKAGAQPALPAVIGAAAEDDPGALGGQVPAVAGARPGRPRLHGAGQERK